MGCFGVSLRCYAVSLETRKEVAPVVRLANPAHLPTDTAIAPIRHVTELFQRPLPMVPLKIVLFFYDLLGGSTRRAEPSRI
jgi:hypothetical protein